MATLIPMGTFVKVSDDIRLRYFHQLTFYRIIYVWRLVEGWIVLWELSERGRAYG